MASNSQRYRRINNKIIRQNTYSTFTQGELTHVHLNDTEVSCNRSRLAMIRKSNPQLGLPKRKCIKAKAKNRKGITVRSVTLQPNIFKYSKGIAISFVFVEKKG